jgi:hypothetical protein
MTGLLLAAALLHGGDVLQRDCAACHGEAPSPPFDMIYKRYLLVHGSKARVRRAMTAFLQAPSQEKSAMPEGMKNRFHPERHPAFDADTAARAVDRIIEDEDVMKRIYIPQKVRKEGA